jgi:hypothetical protein
MSVAALTMRLMPRHPAPMVGAAINTWFARRAVSPMLKLLARQSRLCHVLWYG